MRKDKVSERIIFLLDELARIQERTPQAMGRRVGGGSNLYDRLRAGGSITTPVAHKVLKGIREHWPTAAQWPSDPGDYLMGDE